MYSFFDPEKGVLLKKHAIFFKQFVKALKKETQIKRLFFGGGAGGGKTYLCLFCIVTACRLFPGYRAHIIRKSMSALLKTVEPSLLKLLEGQKVTAHRDKGNYYYEFPNKSRIYLMPEAFAGDKDLDAFKGLETNLIFLEQIEELQQKTYFKSIERAGRYIIPNCADQPQPLILSTMNPTLIKWVRDLIYVPFETNQVPDDTFIQMVTAHNNPFIPAALWESWKSTDPLMYQQYINGDWNAVHVGMPFMHAFKAHTHVETRPVGSSVWISFDFNSNPMTAILASVDVAKGVLYVHKEFRKENSTAVELAREIAPFIFKKQVFITGDATGKNRSAYAEKNMYVQICNALRLPTAAVHLHKRNIGHSISKDICNTLLLFYDVKIDPSCEYLIEDLQRVQATFESKIDKRDLSRSHLLDCFRYLIHINFIDKLRADNRLIVNLGELSEAEI